jgi:endonuclease YncB( thermonuclease family)
MVSDNRQALPAAICLWCICVFSCPAEAAADCDAKPATASKVTGVVDGDTLVLADGATIRLAGVEAPKRLPGAGSTESPSVAAARTTLTDLVLGHEVTAQKVGGYDRYGRIPAIVKLPDGRSAGEEMVARGLARIRWENGCRTPALRQLEAAAQKARLGMWAEPGFAVRKAGDPSLATQKGLYQLVEGRVESVGRGTRLVFLNFGEDWKRDFTVTIATDLALRLAPGGDPVNAFRGKRVLVRGVIEDNGGPQIRVTDEGGIEILGDDGTGAAE